MKTNREYWQAAQKVIPGGVNSPVRAFKAVGGNPPIMARAQGPYIYDVEEKEYIDFIGSWGPMIHGHNNPEINAEIARAVVKGTSFGACSWREIEFAEKLVELIPHIDWVRMVNSGTEATLSAVRLARGVTGRDQIVKFRGCYHGHADHFLIEAGSGVVPTGVPNSAGVTAGAAKDTLLADFNDLDQVEDLFKRSGEQIACVIVEPIAGNMGVVPPEPGFLEGLRSLCSAHGALLIFDEVMTGFRVHPHGAAGLYKVTPDLVTYGKVIGGGMPVGAYGGKAEYMQAIAPLGPVYQAGTLSGNPVAMAAGQKTIELCQQKGFYENLEELGAYFEAGLLRVGSQLSFDTCVQRVGSMVTLFLGKGPIKNFNDAKNCSTENYAKFFRGVLESGLFLPPLQFEAWFISTTHTREILDQALKRIEEALTNLR